jgi:hypothetical protein
VLLVLFCIALAAAFGFLFILEMAPKRSQGVTQRLSELQALGGSSRSILQRRRRQEQTEKLKSVLEAFGETLQERSGSQSAIRLRLIQAGYPTPSAVPIYLATRALLPAALAGGALVMLPFLGF